MKITEKAANAHSEESFAHDLSVLSDSGATVIHVRTQEVMRAILAIRRAVLTSGHTYKEWDIAHGFRDFEIKNYMKIEIDGKPGDMQLDLAQAFSVPGAEARQQNESDGEHSNFKYICYLNPHYWMDLNPTVHHHIQQYGQFLATTNVRILIVTPDISLPEAISGSVATLRFNTPSHTELVEYYHAIIDGIDAEILDINPEDVDKICAAGAGMTKEGFDMYLSLAIVESARLAEEGQSITATDLIEGINKGKTEIVNKNDILELYPITSMDDVGGMENLKDWVNKRKNCYSDEAKDFGVEPPKGIVCVGLSGTGKSLVGKSIASELGVNLIRLDIGRIFNSLVGKSEERMRTALSMIESMAPVCVLVDEIDKALGGADGSSSDSGTSSRVLGTYLTWLQECKSPVFNVVTCNSIQGLPPELLRRGRFDAIFATSFPTRRECLEILDIHLRKRKKDPNSFNMKDKMKVVEAAKGYVPAEIESAVKDGIIDAFSSGEKFNMDHIIKALRTMIPLSKTYAERIAAMTLWAKNNAIPASKPDDDGGDDDTTKGGVVPMSGRKRVIKPH